ncbi:MAG: OmpA family protein [Methylorubrum populi]
MRITRSLLLAGTMLPALVLSDLAPARSLSEGAGGRIEVAQREDAGEGPRGGGRGPGGPGPAERGGPPARERPEPAERPVRPERPAPQERPDRPERPDRSSAPERAAPQPPRPERPEPRQAPAARERPEPAERPTPPAARERAPEREAPARREAPEREAPARRDAPDRPARDSQDRPGRPAGRDTERPDAAPNPRRAPDAPTPPIPDRPERPTPPAAPNAAQPNPPSPPPNQRPGVPGRPVAPHPERPGRPDQPAAAPAAQPDATREAPAGRTQPGAPGRPVAPNQQPGVPGRPVQPPGTEPGVAPPGQPGAVPPGQPAPGQPATPPATPPGAVQPGQPGSQPGGRPDQRERSDRRDRFNVPGTPAYIPGGFRDDDDRVRDYDTVRRDRREYDVDGRTYYREPGRIIVRDRDGTFIRHDENERFRTIYGDRGYRSERRGREVYSYVDSPAGGQIVTVVDDDGRLLRRFRRTRDGREVVLINNVYDGPPRPIYEDVVDLPPPDIRIPRDRYVVDYEQADERTVYQALSAPPVQPLERRYTLDQVRYSPQLRARMPSVDINTINFDTGSFTVTPDQAKRLATIAAAINRAVRANPQEVFLIEGYTDAVGAEIDNLSLSDRRAQSVATVLTQDFQVPPENLTTQGYGEQYLKVNTQEANRENRRVTVRRITPLLQQQAEGQPQPAPR